MRALHLFAVAALLLVPAAAGKAEAPPGASSCSGCHAPSARIDSAVPRLAGRSAAELAAQMQAFKNGQQPSTVMGRIAKGFSDAEIQAIADWYALQN
jgi:cytochrome subunit of sulfide dehydrogenase